MSPTHVQTIITDWLHSCRDIAALPVPGGVPYSLTNYNCILVAKLSRHCCTTCSWWCPLLTTNYNCILLAKLSRYCCTTCSWWCTLLTYKLKLQTGCKVVAALLHYVFLVVSPTHVQTIIADWLQSCRGIAALRVPDGAPYSRTNYNCRLVAQLSRHCCTTCSWWCPLLTYKL